MAHFRAVVQGGRGSASRLGHKSSGISTLLQTWGWDVSVVAYCTSDGRDRATIELKHHSTGERRHVCNLDLTDGYIEGD